MIDQRTPNLNLPLPHPTNALSDDVLRLRDAIIGLDQALNALDVNAIPDAQTAVISEIKAQAELLKAAAVDQFGVETESSINTVVSAANAAVSAQTFCENLASRIAGGPVVSVDGMTGIVTLKKLKYLWIESMTGLKF